jgi:acetate kinase
MKDGMMKVAVVNCGSSSIKYEVFGLPDCLMLATGLIEKIGSAESRLRQRRRNADGTFDEQVHSKELADHREGFDFMAHVNGADRILQDESELFGVGHRVVHGGELFREPTLIDDHVVAAIRSLIPLAPLHNPSNLLGIEIARTRFPGIPHVAVFDTAFHQTLPPRAFHYAVPYDWYTRHHVRRYGFHGTSHRYVSREAARYLGRAPESANLITLHLGNGASCAAVQGGLSIDTSMGLTPLEGLVMGTRSGDIDPALHFFMMRETGMSPEELEKLLNSQAGLKGICGLNDMREIQQQAEGGTERAVLALDMFCYRIRKYIGAYWAVMGRLDAVVFTGGIGENSSTVRSRVCSGLEHMGIGLDEGKNRAVSGSVAEIQTEGSQVKLLVVKTDEELDIARQTVEAVQNAGLKTSAPRANGRLDKGT